MFGIGNKKRVEKLYWIIGEQLKDILAFPRWLNDVRVPDALKTNSYVIGYHAMMAVNLYIDAVKGKTDVEEQGFVLANSMAIALEVDAHDIAAKLESLETTKNMEFYRGHKDANVAYQKILRHDEAAFLEFNNNIRHLHR